MLNKPITHFTYFPQLHVNLTEHFTCFYYTANLFIAILFLKERLRPEDIFGKLINLCFFIAWGVSKAKFATWFAADLIT